MYCSLKYIEKLYLIYRIDIKVSDITEAYLYTRTNLCGYSLEITKVSA